MSRMNWDRVRRERNLYCQTPIDHAINDVASRRRKTAGSRTRTEGQRTVAGRSWLVASELPVIDERVAGAGCTRCGATTENIWPTPAGQRWCSRCDLLWQIAA
jgi:hypothetical protein